MRKILKYTFFLIVIYSLFTMNVFSIFKRSSDNKILQLKGSDTILNLSQKVAEEYMKEHPHSRISVTGGGTGTGIAAKINKTIDIALASREMKKSEYEKAHDNGVDVKEVVIAYDAITIVINKKNRVENLSLEQLKNIYLGKITNWKELGGIDKKIIVISRDSSSGTHLYFKEHVLREGKSKGKEEFGKEVLFLPSNESIKQEVTNSEGAIAYLGLGYVDKNVKPIKIEDVPATVATVKSKTYPIARAVYWYVNENIDGIGKKLIDYMLSDKGQKIVVKEGFVPIK